MKSPILASDIPLKLTAYSFQDPGSTKVRLLVAAEVDRAVNPDGAMALGAVAVDAKGTVVASQFAAELTGPIRAGTSTQSFFGALLVEPGPYTVKIAVVDDGGRRGSVQREVRAYVTRLGPFRVTDLLIGQRNVTGDEIAATDQPVAAVAPTVAADFAGTTLHAYLELSSESPEALASLTVTVEVAGTATSLPMESAVAVLQQPDADPGSRAAAAALSLGLLPAGNYVARAIVAAGGRKVGQVTRPFRIVKPELPR